MSSLYRRLQSGHGYWMKVVKFLSSSGVSEKELNFFWTMPAKEVPRWEHLNAAKRWQEKFSCNSLWVSDGELSAHVPPLMLSDIVGQKSKCWYRVAHNMMMNGKTVILAGRSWPLAHMTYNEWRQKCLDDRLRLGEDKEVKGGGGGAMGSACWFSPRLCFQIFVLQLCSNVLNW